MAEFLPPLTVDQALALVEQERLDELAAREPGDPDHYECAAYVLASEVRKLRAARVPPSAEKIRTLLDAYDRVRPTGKALPHYLIRAIEAFRTESAAPNFEAWWDEFGSKRMVHKDVAREAWDAAQRAEGAEK